MFCQRCGTDVGDARFCPKCGERILGAEDPCYIPPSDKMVNKIVYALLAIILGSLGIHRFYAGKIASGILYLVLDLFVIGWFILPFLSIGEGLVALTREDDGNGNIPVYRDKYFV